jgi:hypothetical protein
MRPIYFPPSSFASHRQLLAARRKSHNCLSYGLCRCPSRIMKGRASIRLRFMVIGSCKAMYEQLCSLCHMFRAANHVVLDIPLMGDETATGLPTGVGLWRRSGSLQRRDLSNPFEVIPAGQVAVPGPRRVTWRASIAIAANLLCWARICSTRSRPHMARGRHSLHCNKASLPGRTRHSPSRFPTSTLTHLRH